MARFEEIPEVSFMGDITLAGLKKTAVEEYNAALSELTGGKETATDEMKAVLHAAAQIVYQSAAAINQKARQNLLKYSTGAYLDNLALNHRLTRKQAEKAVVTVKFELSAQLESVVAIPQGTRVTGGAGGIYFETAEYAEIPAGETSANISCIATAGGEGANRFSEGELNILVDPIPYIASVSNIEPPSGGADAESDDALANRIFAARYNYSTTGSEDAYIYYTKAFSTLIKDVRVENPQDAEIYIYILMTDGEPATETFLEELKAYLDKSDKKPLTDKITVKSAENVSYSIDVEYKIRTSDAARISKIQSEAGKAIAEYKRWQSEKIGRDIDNQRLLALLIDAGAKQVKINAPPVLTAVRSNQIAYCTGVSAKYTGLTDE